MANDLDPFVDPQGIHTLDDAAGAARNPPAIPSRVLPAGIQN